MATLTGAMCKTSQCELRSLRVNSGMLNVIRITPIRVASLFLDGNGDFAIKAYTTENAVGTRNLALPLQEYTEIHESQFGCISGRSTKDAIFLLKARKKERHREGQKGISVTSIDLEKSYDMVQTTRGRISGDARGSATYQQRMSDMQYIVHWLSNEGAQCIRRKRQLQCGCDCTNYLP